MCDIVTTTMLWKGDTSEIKNIDTWDAIESGDNEEESGGEDGKEGKTGGFETKEAGPKWNTKLHCQGMLPRSLDLVRIGRNRQP
jgi:hypothetical protein